MKALFVSLLVVSLTSCPALARSDRSVFEAPRASGIDNPLSGATTAGGKR